MRVKQPYRDIRSTSSKNGAVVVTGVFGHHQRDGFSCGSAAVATVLRAYTGSLTGDDWRRIVAVSKPSDEDGVPTRKLTLALEEFGLPFVRSHWLTRDAASQALAAGDLLVTTMQVPEQIGGDETHWVVIAGASRKKVLVLNHTGFPLYSKRWLDWEYFMENRPSRDAVVRVQLGIRSWVANRM